MKIAIATSTRADWGLLLPLARELASRDHDISVLATGMHLMPSLGHTVDEIAACGFDPLRIHAEGDMAHSAAAALTGFAGALSSLQPDCLVLLGDRFEMLGVAAAALSLGIPIAHIAGGTASEGALDDSVRHAITKMASLHLVETDLCRRRVVQMGEDPAKILTCGAPGVWNALNVPLMSRAELEGSLGASLPPHFFVATLHPATLEAASPLKRMQDFLDGIGDFMLSNPDYGVILTYPNNDVDPAPQ